MLFSGARPVDKFWGELLQINDKFMQMRLQMNRAWRRSTSNDEGMVASRGVGN